MVLSPGILDKRVLLSSLKSATSERHRQLFSALIEARRILMSILVNFRLSEDQMEDVMQNTLIITLKNLDKIRNFKAFMAAVTKRLCIQYKQRIRAIEQRECFWPATALENIEADRSLDLTDLLALEKAMNCLPGRQRDLVWLSCCGYSEEEIATTLRLRKLSIRKIRSRGWARLRKMMEGTMSVPIHIRAAGSDVRPALEELWRDLPVRLRRRRAKSLEEQCLVLDLVDRAASKGANHDEAAKVCGVSPKDLLAWRLRRLLMMKKIDQLRDGLEKFNKSEGVVYSTRIRPRSKG